ncbi:hypothetical protein [Prevotella sp.]|uniref:hypothetical protein n=1 Tax=Prevotella sp. TaxID=59823 RepID=UPI003AF4ADAC
MVQSFAATIINAKHVSMAFCRQQQWLTNRQYTFPHGGWSHEHIDKDKQKENLLRRLLLFVEEGKHEQPTIIAMLQTRSIPRQKLHCTKSSKKGVVADFISYKEAGRHFANITIKA